MYVQGSIAKAATLVTYLPEVYTCDGGEKLQSLGVGRQERMQDGKSDDP